MGSEMCIRDRSDGAAGRNARDGGSRAPLDAHAAAQLSGLSTLAALPAAQLIAAAGGGRVSILDAICSLAAERDVPFAPRVGRRAEPGGQQVYALGGLSVHVDADKGIVFARARAADAWAPVSLHELLERAVASVGARGGEAGPTR